MSSDAVSRSQHQGVTLGRTIRRLSGRSIAVLGSTGFLGRALTSHLSQIDCELTLISRTSVVPGRDVGDAVVRHVCADVTDTEKMKELLSGAEIIFQLAGLSGAALSNARPLSSLYVNGLGGLAVLEAARESGRCPSIVFASSRLVYSPDARNPVAETAEVRPRSAYGLHKALTEQHHRLYAEWGAIRSTVLRITNPYGVAAAADSPGYGVANQFLAVARQNGVIPIYGDGSQLRDYVHVDDVVRAMIIASARTGDPWRVYNVGSGAGTPLVDMARLAVAVGRGGGIAFVPWPKADLAVETGSFVADTKLIHKELGWRPIVSLEEGLRRVLAGSTDGGVGATC